MYKYKDILKLNTMKQFVLINKETSGVTKFPAFSKEQLKSEIAEPKKYIIREFNL